MGYFRIIHFKNETKEKNLFSLVRPQWLHVEQYIYDSQAEEWVDVKTKIINEFHLVFRFK